MISNKITEIMMAINNHTAKAQSELVYFAEKGDPEFFKQLEREYDIDILTLRKNINEYLDYHSDGFKKYVLHNGEDD